MTTQKHTTNPTRIVTIPKSDISIGLVRNPQTKAIERMNIEKFDADSLSELPRESRIAVMAKARFSEMTFDAGTVGAISMLRDVSLNEIDKSYPLHIRIIVFDDKDKRILASCERLKIYESDEGGIKSLLPVEPVDLGEELWRLSAAEEERPILQVHSDTDVGMLEKIAHDPLCQALVLPAAIRGALGHLLASDRDEDTDSWQSNWIRYLAALQIELPDDDEDEDADQKAQNRARWLDDAMTRITRNLGLKTHLSRHYTELPK